MNRPKALRAFCSYSHRDQVYHQRLCTALAQLKREGTLELWHDGMIVPGEKWEEKIVEALNQADIVLLLVSPDFLESDYCWNNETLESLRRYDNGLVQVLPIILRPCDWKHSRIASIQALPKNGFPVSKYQSEDDAFLEITEGIRHCIARIKVRSSGSPAGGGSIEHQQAQGIAPAPIAIQLKDISAGPMVPLYRIPTALVRELANLQVERAPALDLLHASTRALKELDRNATIVELAAVPAFSAGPYQFWQSVFHEACRHGPRMVAALLLALPTTGLSDDVSGQCHQLLSALATGAYQ